jgi:Zinc carboxypeptidase/Secretion system C-terminal sorting domain
MMQAGEKTTMRFALLTLSLLLLAGTSFAQPDALYHDLDEAYQFLYDLEAAYPQTISVETVGYSQEDDLPLLLVKISDNVAVEYDRPTVLIVGHIHGEEIIGLEIVLRAIEALATFPNLGNPFPEFRDRREQLEMYFVPTMNPEGLRVVHGDEDDPDLIDGPDISYRKNKRDNVGDGIFRYHVGLGNDSSGVDLNRNWGLNWFNGDTLFHLHNEYEAYDYYRGRHPFSEAETQVVRAVHELVQPLYGITYHSSRTGNLSEKVFYPWDWGLDNLKMAPDIDLLDDVGITFANQITKLDGVFRYTPGRSGGRNAKMHDWTYAAGNWINLECEVSDSDIQTDDPEKLEYIITTNLDGLYYLVDRARGSEDLPAGSSGYLEVHVQDQNGQPLVAEVFTPEFWNGYLSPRYTDLVFGVHRRPLLAQDHTIITRAFGYEPDTSVVNVSSTGPARYTITLDRKPHSWLHLSALDVNEEHVPATFVVHRDLGIDTIYSAEGDWGGNMPHGDYTVETWATGLIPKVETFTSDSPFLMQVTLVEPEGETFDDFEAGVPQHWVSAGDYSWERSGFEALEGDASLKSDPDLFLDASTTGEVTAQYDFPADMASLVLTGFIKCDTEPDYDNCVVEVSDGGDTWEQVDFLNGVCDWRSFVYDLRDYVDGGAVFVRWTMTTDETETDRGIFLDNVKLQWSTDSVTVDESMVQPFTWAFHAAYPNPFNPSTHLRFDLAEAANVSLVVYDLLGREVVRVVDEQLQAGPHLRNLDMSGFASGMYFARISAGPMQEMRKIVLMK